MGRRVIVGFSGGVTSAWCAGWALRQYPKDEVILLFHDTKAEDEDTYRFLREMSEALEHSVTERSDGRSLDQVFEDEDAIANNRMAFCSRILKTRQFEMYVKELQGDGHENILNVVGFTKTEWKRMQRVTARCNSMGIDAIFPLADHNVTKQQAYDWCVDLGVRPPRMYEWADHANCVGCVRGGKAYWLRVAEHAPEVFNHRCRQEERYGHTVLKDISLPQLKERGLLRCVKRKDQVETVPCECVG